MIAKIIAYGRTREEALARLRRAMRETTVVIEGGATNKSFILDLLDQPEVVAGGVEGGPAWADTAWIDRARGEGRLVVHEHSGVAVVAAGIEAYEDEKQVEIARLLQSAHGGRPQVQHQVGRAVDFKLRGASYKVTVLQSGPHRFRVTVAAGSTTSVVEVDLDRLDEFHTRLTVGDRVHRLVTATHGPVHLVEVDGVAHRVSRDEGGVLRSPAPALVVASPVAVGELVEAGAPVLVLESMKMETVLRSPFAARVRELLAATGSQVETGAPLVRLEPVADDEGEQDAAADTGDDHPDLDLPPTGPVVAGQVAGQQRATRGLEDLSAMLMGYDTDAQNDDSVITGYLRDRAELVGAGVDVLTHELELLERFADFAELSRNRPAGEELQTELRVHSSKEHFHTYLQTLDADRGALPQQFRDRLARVLAHYGVTDWDRTPELEEAVFRIFLAQQRSAPEVRLATALLQRWMTEPPPPEEQAGAVRDLLERLVRSTQLRFPAVGDLARITRFRWFDQPLVDAERSTVLAGVRDEVAALAADLDAPDRTARLEALAAIPEQIVRFLAERLESGVPEQEPMLEVLVRRHYREHDLHGLRSTLSEGRTVAVADYVLDDRPTHLVSTEGTFAELGTAAAPWCAPSPTRSPRDPTVTRPWSTSTSPGRRCRTPRTAPARSSPRSSPRCPSPTTCAASRWPCAPTRTDRSPTSPTAPTRTPAPASSRTTWSAGCTRWSGAASTCGACATSTSPASRRPRTCCSTSASPGRTPPTGASWPWPRSASSPSSATRRGA